MSDRHFFPAALKPACATILLGVPLAGCMSPGAGTRLEAPDAPAFRNAAAATAQPVPASAPALALWWRGFGDPELSRLVETALTANLDIAQAQSRVAEADALLRSAAADRGPGGSVGGSVARQRQSLEGPIGQFARNAPGYRRDQTVFEAAAEASWEVDLFGRLAASARAARADRTEMAALLDGVRVRIAAETADAYLCLMGAREQLALVAAQVDVQQRLARVVAQRFAAGDAGTGEVDAAKADLARTQSLASEFAIEAEAQANRLRVLTGGAAEIAATARAVPDAPALSALDTPAVVLRRRPDVRAAEARVMASDARTGAALAEYYPAISLGGQAGVQALDADRLLTGPALSLGGLIGLRWRLFDFKRIDAEVAASRARGSGALAAYRATMLTASEEVENSLFRRAERSQQRDRAAENVAALTRLQRSQRRSFEAGILPLAALLEVERRLLAARQEFLSARIDAARAAVASFRAVGGWIG